MRRLAFLALTLATGCSDALEKTSSAGQVIGVINADLSLVSATDFSVTTRSWPGTTTRPSAIAGGGRTFVVTLEQANAVGVSLLVTCRLILSRCVRGLITCCPSLPGRNPTVSP